MRNLVWDRIFFGQTVLLDRLFFGIDFSFVIDFSLENLHIVYKFMSFFIVFFTKVSYTIAEFEIGDLFFKSA